MVGYRVFFFTCQIRGFRHVWSLEIEPRNTQMAGDAMCNKSSFDIIFYLITRYFTDCECWPTLCYTGLK